MRASTRGGRGINCDLQDLARAEMSRGRGQRNEEKFASHAKPHARLRACVRARKKLLHVTVARQTRRVQAKGMRNEFRGKDEYGTRNLSV